MRENLIPVRMYNPLPDPVMITQEQHVADFQLWDSESPEDASSDREDPVLNVTQCMSVVSRG